MKRLLAILAHAPQASCLASAWARPSGTPAPGSTAKTLQSYGCVIDAVVDPNMLALPPHVTFDQTKNYLAAIRKGDREAAPHVALLKAGVT